MSETWQDTFLDKVIHGDCSDYLLQLPDNSIDLLVTDPPYGIQFMGKDWDKALPSIHIWRKCRCVLKPGAFMFVMCIPRLDCLGEMSRRLQEAEFNLEFTPIFWAYASGFPKPINIGKTVDKQAGEPPLAKAFNVAGKGDRKDSQKAKQTLKYRSDYGYIHKPKSEQAQTLDGAYGGFQPKPAVEIIIVAMKPLAEKTFIEQALKNQKGVTWLDDARIPHKEECRPMKKQSDESLKNPKCVQAGRYKDTLELKSIGRFPANLLVSDDVLDDGTVHESHSSKTFHQGYKSKKTTGFLEGISHPDNQYSDKGGFSRYFSLEAWWAERIKQLPEQVQQTFPFLVVPKASKAEKNKGCEKIPPKIANPNYGKGGFKRPTGEPEREISSRGNYHPTVKPIQLMSYLVTLGSRPEDIILDPFIGTGTTGIACKLLDRHFIGFEINEEYCRIAEARLAACSRQKSLSDKFCEDVD